MLPTEQILPSPFEWKSIPAGSVTLVSNTPSMKVVKTYLGEMGASQSFEVGSFSIGKYPITNAQFNTFIEADGYNTQGWWTEDGWEKREKDSWTEPYRWKDEKIARFFEDDQPVVGVSWYEAAAFCQWLASATGENISLPTDEQCQRASQGDDRRIYPWGNEWDPTRCNHNVDFPENSLQKTNPVTLYEGKGDSPYGVVDMSGNVQEWCLTNHETGDNSLRKAEYRVSRGGCWVNLGENQLKTDFRFYSPALVRGQHLITGFRIARNE